MSQKRNTIRIRLSVPSFKTVYLRIYNILLYIKQRLYPLFRLVDASREDEARDAVIGYDTAGRLLFVVHIMFEDECIRIISARKATPQERKDHDSQ